MSTQNADRRFWAWVILVGVFGLFIGLFIWGPWASFHSDTGPYTKQEAHRVVCRNRLQLLASELERAERNGRLTFENGFDVYIENLVSSSQLLKERTTPLLLCPTERKRGPTPYKVAQIESSKKLRNEVSEEGSTVLVADKKGYHKGGRNVMAVDKTPEGLDFFAEWRPEQSDLVP